MKSLRELRAEVANLEGDLDNTDQEMLTVKAILVFLFDQSEKLNAKSDMLTAAIEAVEETLESTKVIRDGQPGDGELTVPQARQVAQQLAKANALLNAVAGFTDRLLDANYRSVTLSKIRADTKARQAEQKSVEQFAKLCQLIRGIVIESAPDDDWLNAFESTLERQLYSPLHLKMPDRNLTPDDLN